MVIYLIYFN